MSPIEELRKDNFLSGIRTIATAYKVKNILVVFEMSSEISVDVVSIDRKDPARVAYQTIAGTVGEFFGQSKKQVK